MDRNLNRRAIVASLVAAPMAMPSASLSHFVRVRSNSLKGSTNRFQAPVSAGSIDARSTALLVMDFQPAWIETLSESADLLDRAASAIGSARQLGVAVVYTRVAFEPADYAAVPPGNMIFQQLTATPGALDDDAPRTAVADAVAPEPKDKVIRKTRVSAFERTDLDEWLRGMQIDTLLLTGISTSGVVLSTVCDGADLDYRLFVVADACADRDAEIQDVLIGKIFPQRAQMVRVADLPALIS